MTTPPHRHDPATAAEDPRTHWDARYGAAESLWSGQVNATLAGVLADLPPGRSVDLGCGEGGDVLWLAERGWDARGLDLSAVAVERARAEADRRGLSDGADPADGAAGRARFAARDLTDWVPDPDSLDLVTASFFHSEVALERTAILRAATEGLAPGGHLVVLSHAAPPPWAAHAHAHGPAMLSAAEELAELDPDPVRWEVRVAEQRTRPVTDPEGRPAELEDSLLVLRRRDVPTT